MVCERGRAFGSSPIGMSVPPKAEDPHPDPLPEYRERGKESGRGDVGAGSYFAASLWARVATCLPWARAMASSLALGWRSPLGPAMVEAP